MAEEKGWLERFVETFGRVMSGGIMQGFDQAALTEVARSQKRTEGWFGRFFELIGIKEAEDWTAMLKRFVDAGMIEQEQADQLLNLKDLAPPIDTFLYFYIVFMMCSNYLDTLSFAASGKLRQALNVQYSPEVLPPREVMMAAFIAPEKTGEVRGAMKRAGLSDEDIDLMFLAAYKLYDEDMVRVLWLRGVLSDDQMYMRMRELGYTDTRTKEIIQSWPLIPGPQDLFTMVGKEAFEPEFIQKIGLGAEFPVEQVEWLKKQGVSEEWALRYWYAHWEQPSIGQGFEMLHRGVIDDETLDLLFRAVEIPPFWRDKLKAIAYQPLTRVDVRRMHDMGVLTDEELKKSYMDLGYNEENAIRMTEFTVRYNRGKEKELTRGQLIQGYRDKVIPRNDAIELLVQTDYNEAQAEYFLTLEDYKEQKEYQDDMIDNIRDRFINNLMEDFEARGSLNNLNLPAIQVDLLMDKWKIKQYTGRKVPSKSDLDKFLRNKIIDEDTYRLEMQRLGYGFQYIEWYFKQAKLKS
jgi:hypothetical protein